MTASEMQMVLVIVVLAGLSVRTQPAAGQTAPAHEPASNISSPALPALPPTPGGTTTIFGGQIKSVDPVRDQFELDIFGQRPMKILFDERTKVYRDGTKFPVLDLGPADYASVQTALDGVNVFAVSVHILSHSPEGDSEGRVLSYDPRTRELVISSPESPAPVKLSIPENVAIVREGQPSFTSAPSGPDDLVPGAIVSAAFQSEAGRQGTVSRIAVLAVPGSSFLFNGNVSFLDLHAGVLMLVDPKDNKQYEVHFSPDRLAISQNLRIGENVTVAAGYDGRQYVANKVTIN
jgi:hypothetical protein